MRCLSAKEQICSSRNGDAISRTHGCLCIDSSIVGHSSSIRSFKIALSLTSLRGYHIQTVGITTEHQEHLLARGIITHRGVYHSPLFGGYLQVEGVIGAILPTTVLHRNLRRKNSECGVVSINIELNSTTHRYTISSSCRQQIRAIGCFEGVLVTCGVTHIYRLIGRDIHQRLNKLTLSIHCHLNLGGKSITHCKQCQCHDT